MTEESEELHCIIFDVRPAIRFQISQMYVALVKCMLPKSSKILRAELIYDTIYIWITNPSEEWAELESFTISPSIGSNN